MLLLAYVLFALVFALISARYWHRKTKYDLDGIPPRLVFVMAFFFTPLAVVFVTVSLMVDCLVWCIEYFKLGERLDALIEWKN